MNFEVFNKKKAFVGYFTFGSEPLEYQIEAAIALEKGGVDILEIGMPYSDPIADGPVIQDAMLRSLKRQTKSVDVIAFIKALRTITTIPIVLFSYYNPLFQLGEKFQIQLINAGVNALLILDLPMEEQKVISTSLCNIPIATPSTSNERAANLSRTGKGFIYYVCQKGTTGMRNEMPPDYAQNISRIKSQTNLPIVAGFGISSLESARQAIEHANGFVVGSLFVKAMSARLSSKELEDLARSLDPR